MNAGTLLTPHFTAGELTRDGALLGAFLPAPYDVQANLLTTAHWLEAARQAIGAPLRITSGYRPPAKNAATPGASPTSSHLVGLAADFVPVGVSLWTAYVRLRADRRLPPWDQLIFYPGHIHVGLAPRLRGQVLIRLSEGLSDLTARLVDRLPGAPVLILLVLLLLLTRGKA